MPHWMFRISLMDLAFAAAIVTGIVFGILLLVARRLHHSANRLLGLAVLVMVLWLCWVLGIDVWLQRYFPHWSWLPWQWSLALGPLVYLYVRKVLNPSSKFKQRVWLHFVPALAEQYVLAVTIAESKKTGIPPFDTRAFAFFSPVLSVMALVSVLCYTLLSIRELRRYRNYISGQLSDTENYNYRWLQRLLLILFLLWSLWLPYTLVDYLGFGYRLPLSAYHPLHLALAIIVIWIGAEAFLRPEVWLVNLPDLTPEPQKDGPTPEILEQAVRIRRQIEQNLFYLDPELSLRGLAEKLGLHPQELSHIINAGTGQNFSDFINSYRVAEVKRKMDDPAFAHITLLGIAYASGFNSKTTFNRTFKRLTGGSPALHKKGAI